jgi:hypothetical protein
VIPWGIDPPPEPTRKRKPQGLTDLDNVDPDRWPSSSASFAEDRGHDVIWVLEVEGLGVIVLRAIENPEDKTKLIEEGMSTFTDGEIRSGRVHVD